MRIDVGGVLIMLLVIGFMVRAFVRGYKQGKNNNGNRE